MWLNGKKIKHILIDRGMRQNEFAKHVGITPTTLSMICNGKSCLDETAQKIADALGVKVEELTNN